MEIYFGLYFSLLISFFFPTFDPLYIFIYVCVCDLNLSISQKVKSLGENGRKVDLIRKTGFFLLSLSYSRRGCFVYVYMAINSYQEYYQAIVFSFPPTKSNTNLQNRCKFCFCIHSTLVSCFSNACSTKTCTKFGRDLRVFLSYLNYIRFPPGEDKGTFDQEFEDGIRLMVLPEDKLLSLSKNFPAVVLKKHQGTGQLELETRELRRNAHATTVLRSTMVSCFSAYSPTLNAAVVVIGKKARYVLNY